MKNFPDLKARETISAILLSAPAICTGKRLDACRAWIRNPSMRSSLPATLDLDVLSLFAQDTADVLSQKTPMW